MLHVLLLQLLLSDDECPCELRELCVCDENGEECGENIFKMSPICESILFIFWLRASISSLISSLMS